MAKETQPRISGAYKIMMFTANTIVIFEFVNHADLIVISS